MEIDDSEAVWDILLALNDRDESAKFIFVLDEWDYIFHQSFVTEEDEFSQYFGFTEEEADMLFDRYLSCTAKISRF